MNWFVKWLFGEGVGQTQGPGELSIEFTAEIDNYVTLGLVVVLAAMVYLTVRSYRREGDAPKRAKALLGTLRVTVIVLVMAAILRPAIVLRVVRELHSAVVVLMDDSLSMARADRYAQQRQYGRQLAQKLNVTDGDLAAMSRQDIARRVLAAPGGPVDKLAKDHPIVVMRFSTTQPGVDAYTKVLQTIDRVQRRQGGPASAPADAAVGDPFKGLKSGGLDTRIPSALRDAIEMMQGGRVAALVLVSDGQNTAADGEDRLSGVLAYASQRRVPLYSLAVGDPTPPRNVAVAGLGAPREARKGAKLEFHAVISHRNAAGESVPLRLERRPAAGGDWVDTGAGKSVTLEAPPQSADGEKAPGLQSVTLQVDADAAGEFVYRAIIDPQPWELNADDNSAQTPVTIGEELVSVLLISGDAGWEYQYLRNLLMSQPKVYRVSVWQQNLSEGVTQMASSKEFKLSRLPRTLDELMGVKGDQSRPGYDVVILNDPRPVADSFDTLFAEELLEKFVDRGRGLCYIAGNKYTEGVLLGNKDFSSLATLMPVVPAPGMLDVRERIGKAPEPWQLQVGAYGRDHQVTRMAPTADDSDNVWRALPGVYWTQPVAKVKPAGHVLAENSNPVRRTSKGEAEPVVVTQQYGKGRVLYVGTDDTWRWRVVRDGYYHKRFWTNAVSYLATARSRRVMITAGGDRFSAGDKINIEVEAYDEKHQPIRDKTFTVEMVNAKTRAAVEIVLQPVPDRPGRYRTEYRPAEIGSFELTVPAESGLDPGSVASKRIEIELPQAEALRPEADEAMLKTIASRPENFLRIDQADKLGEMIPPDRLQSVEQRRHELWDTNLMLLAVLALLSAEWILRKKYNMT